MSDVTLEFTGRCPKVVPRPIPLEAKSMRTGEVVFNPTATVTHEEAQYLLSLGTAFKQVSAAPVPVVTPPAGRGTGTPLYHPEKWKTKPEAQAFLETELGGAGNVRQVGRIFKIVMNDHEV